MSHRWLLHSCGSMNSPLWGALEDVLASHSWRCSLGWWKAHDAGAVLGWIIDASLFQWPAPACLPTAGGRPLPFAWKASACSEPPKSLQQSFVRFKTDTVIIPCNTSQKCSPLNACTIWATPGELQASLIMHPCLSIDLDNWYLEASSDGVLGFFHTG